MRRQRGSLFLDAIVLGAVFAAATAMVFPMLSAELNQDLADDARSQIRQLRRAAEAFHSDVGRLPTQLQELNVQPAGATNWLGPYLNTNFRDYDSAGLTCVTDPWRQPFAFESGSGSTLTIRSKGANGIDEHGLGDDLFETFDMNRSAWEITRQELRVLRSAITAYNANVTDPTLPSSWMQIVTTLQSHNLLAGGLSAAADYQTDAWGRQYVPQGTPVNSVSTLGPQ